MFAATTRVYMHLSTGGGSLRRLSSNNDVNNSWYRFKLKISWWGGLIA